MRDFPQKIHVPKTSKLKAQLQSYRYPYHYDNIVYVVENSQLAAIATALLEIKDELALLNSQNRGETQ